MKDQEIERRSFLKYAATATIATGFLSRSEPVRAGRTGAKLRKALQLGMLPKKLSDADKFKLARKCGFEGIEGSPVADLDAARRLGKLARNAGTPIHSIVFGGWHAPFSSPDPKVIDKGLNGMETALRSAKALGAVMCTQAAGKQAVAIGHVNLVTPASACGADRAGTNIGPHINIILCVSHRGGLSGGATGCVDAHDIIHRYCAHPKGIVLTQVFLVSTGKSAQVGE